MSSIIKNYLLWIKKFANGKTIIYLMIITFAVYGFMLFYTIPSVMEHSDGIKLFDIQPLGYSFEYAKLFLETLGKEGREIYLFRQLPVDFIYPFLFAVSFSLLLMYLYRKVFNEDSWIYWTCFIPLFAGLFDYCENIGIIIMLTSYPDLSTGLVMITSIYTLTKSLLTIVFWILLLVSLVMIVIRKLKIKKSRPQGC